MKVFLSWSGERSKNVAKVFFDWLPQIIQALEPWISTNIPKGARSLQEISSELEKSNIGIICLTQDNLDSNWILFEAGALSKMNNTKVCPFLLDVNPSNIKPPLSQFQHSNFTKESVFDLLNTINQQLVVSNEKPLPEKTLHQVFERSWSEFNDRISEILKSSPEKAIQIRSDRDILEEILATIRMQDRGSALFSLTKEDADLLEIAEKKYQRLIKEFGVRPSEAVKSVLNEMDSSGTLISPILRNAMYEYLRKTK
jgi:hypothetical protein